MILPVALLALLLTTSNAADFQEGDACGITSADFLTPGFAGEHLVAGQSGCGLGDKENCYCAPNYGDEDRLSDWIWQCDDAVQFGPISGKTCPAEVPVKQNAIVGGGVDCDIALNPTGVQEDPVCSYSTCDEGGDRSSICACINKANYGLGGGTQQWLCLHSTCSCKKDDEQQQQENDTSVDVTAVNYTDVEGTDVSDTETMTPETVVPETAVPETTAPDTAVPATESPVEPFAPVGGTLEPKPAAPTPSPDSGSTTLNTTVSSLMLLLTASLLVCIH